MSGELAKEGTYLVVQWLRIHLAMWGLGSIPGWGPKTPHATWGKKEE